jgi:hypothetical protein
MSLWNKVLAWIIGVFSLALFFMAAWTLQTHRYWCDLAQKAQQQIELKQKANEALVKGDANQWGIRQLRVELKNLLVDRPRMWSLCKAEVKLNRQDGSVQVILPLVQPKVNDFQPTLDGIAANMLLYGFDSAPVQNKGRYIGEFKVAMIDPKQKLMLLVPTTPPSADELNRMATVSKLWDFYEFMPRDSVQLATSADGKTVRPLIDYQVLYDAFRRQRAALIDRVQTAATNLKLVEDALALAKQQEEAAGQEVAAAKQTLKAADAQRDAVLAYRKLVEKELDAVKATIAQLIESNKAMAGRLARRQWDAVRRIDQRTRAMAQSDAGGS